MRKIITAGLSCFLLFASGCIDARFRGERVEITVVDHTAPTITILKKTSTITEGDKFDLTKCYSVKDNYTKDPAVEYSGDKFDASKPGTYRIHVTVTDNDGNTAEGTFTVIVKEKPKPTPEPTPLPTHTPEPAHTPEPNHTQGSIQGNNGSDNNSDHQGNGGNSNSSTGESGTSSSNGGNTQPSTPTPAPTPASTPAPTSTPAPVQEPATTDPNVIHIINPTPAPTPVPTPAPTPTPQPSSSSVPQYFLFDDSGDWDAQFYACEAALNARGYGICDGYDADGDGYAEGYWLHD